MRVAQVRGNYSQGKVIFQLQEPLLAIELII